MRVLLVEDDSATATSIEMMLRAEGFICDTTDLGEDGLEIAPSAMHPAAVETYDDHRIAMSFAVAGLKTPGVVICDPDCVAKSFPDFWEYFEGLS
jgi:3-phosphoshikimate 1-carboxyvinyltransferase